MRTNLVKVSFVALAWTAGYFFAGLFADGMAAVSGYSILCGWWFALFVCAKLDVKLVAILPLALGYYAVFMMFSMAGWQWFYHDSASAPLTMLAIIGLLQSVFVGSPIAFNLAYDVGAQFVITRVRSLR